MQEREETLLNLTRSLEATPSYLLYTSHASSRGLNKFLGELAAYQDKGFSFCDG